MKPTPGPWMVFSTTVGIGVAPASNVTWGDIAWVLHQNAGLYNSNRSREECGANACLMAAAPDLLAALKAINAHWEAGNFSRTPELWDAMREAIANAEGTK